MHTPDRHDLHCVAARAAVDVERLLAARPTSWLVNFLRLATVGHRSSVGASTQPRYRLVPLSRLPSGAGQLAFHWQPRADPDLFRTFSGRIVIEPSGPQECQLRLTGHTTGGSAAVNSAVLLTLLELLVSALQVDHDPLG